MKEKALLLFVILARASAHEEIPIFCRRENWAATKSL
jgi:hypothetical protein